MPRIFLLFIKEWRRPGIDVFNLSGFSTPFLLRWLCVSILWICGSTEALTTKISTIITHQMKNSWVLLVLLWCRQMTNLQGHFWLFKTVTKHEESFLHAFLQYQSMTWSWVQGCCFFGPKPPLMLVYTPDLFSAFSGRNLKLVEKVSIKPQNQLRSEISLLS